MKVNMLMMIVQKTTSPPKDEVRLGRKKTFFLTYSVGDALFRFRVKFYLGPMCRKNFLPEISPGDLVCPKQFDGGLPLYAQDLRNKLQSLGYLHRKIHFAFGDIQHQTSAHCVVKNRCPDNFQSVVVRCLDFDRHWNLVYSPRLNEWDIPWDQKAKVAIWRGVTTGLKHRARFRLVTQWWGRSVDIDVGFSEIVQDEFGYEPYLKSHMSVAELLRYRYILSVPGNDKDSGLNWKLRSGSVVLMAKPRVTSWLMETLLVPGYHYVLLKDDYSDLDKKVQWCKAHDATCRAISRNASKFMNMFMNEQYEQKIERAVFEAYFRKLDTVFSV
mmetsp:Transcript_4036/g.6231  ORF Transcript_4036/g.6231 Transcript_4036/m.6231 type:complete len:328 (+) Transcript_4036:1519-2502(+)|eukprot:CAMPEP_0175112190 /NCGR_PEP_ID=MMETSP0086_2-20121207/15315_1 /TAXON_ID=136419 /ORGANISM="Unknown Unknown, Strain D1" /LENGTH=327 /DNA_ID=CAMNT_0016391005 /DNA_START=249 /DNA_END=1232 /DNA_ORIENTATION=-